MANPTISDSPPNARLLDLTRLVSRVGRGPWTGVDRVEAAYLAQLLNDPLPLFALVRGPLGFILLDRAATSALSDRLAGKTQWGAPDALSRLALRAAPARRAAMSDLRRLALARSGKRGLAAMLARHLPAGTAWINVGHSNLHAEVFDAIHRLPGGRASVLVHDMIPLDHPGYQRPGTVAGFSEKMRAVAQGADLVICNSAVTEEDAARHFAGLGQVPPMLVAHLGVEPPRPDPGALPAGLDLARPYFVTLGTIEPRKNHALLLDVWEHFAATLPEAEIPTLYIVGARGWANEAVFARLDAAPPRVHELAGLSDGAVAALVRGARALLMPSHVEGFGLPPAEALALGTPVIANDLPVYWEILGNNPIYANAGEMYSWSTKILGLARDDGAGKSAVIGGAQALPTWQDHFNLVLKVT